MITAHLIANKITSNSSEAFATFEKSRFGEKSEQKIIYSSFETLFLVETKKMEIKDYQENILSEKELIKKFHKSDKDFETKYAVFKDLREKGLIVKTALKFGSAFRIYDKGDKIGQSHSKWICQPVKESSKISWHDFAAKNRVAHSTKKKLLIAIVDDEDDVSYSEVSWIRVQ